MQSLHATLARQADLAPLILRVTLGALLLYHGIDKFNTGLGNVEGFFDSQGVPLAGLTAPLTAVGEIIIGLALIAGIGTRIAAATGSLIMVGALAFVKLPEVLGSSELDLAYLAGLLAIVVLGPGAISVDAALRLDRSVLDLRDSNPSNLVTT